MARCGCAGGTCTCSVVAGEGLDVTGGGTKANPYRIGRLYSTTRISTINTQTIALTISGSGTGQDPFILTGENRNDLLADHVVTTTIFLSDGTWVKPPTGQYADVTVIAAGGGGEGGSKQSGPSTADGAGGWPGGGAGVTRRKMLLSELDAAIPVIVGSGGSGGNGGSVTALPGAGAAGGGSSFGSSLRAGGGHIGSRVNWFPYSGNAGVTNQARATAFGTDPGDYYPGDTLPSSKDPVFSRTLGGGRGGKGGGNLLPGPGAYVAAEKGGDSPVIRILGGTLGQARPTFPVGGQGGNGDPAPGTPVGGGAGGGGGGLGQERGGKGGDGGFPGGGGGGGGGNLTSGSSGAGGAGGRGADGIVIVKTY